MKGKYIIKSFEGLASTLGAIQNQEIDHSIEVIDEGAEWDFVPGATVLVIRADGWPWNVKCPSPWFQQDVDAGKIVRVE
jgi:hypothetical protein